MEICCLLIAVESYPPTSVKSTVYEQSRIVRIIGKEKAKGGATMMKERFRLTFVCSEPGCDKTAVVLYDARPAETLEQLRQRNPIFLAVLCGAKHSGNYPASAAIDITVPAPSK
jgi:hypothetical protein